MANWNVAGSFPNRTIFPVYYLSHIHICVCVWQLSGYKDALNWTELTVCWLLMLHSCFSSGFPQVQLQGRNGLWTNWGMSVHITHAVQPVFIVLPATRRCVDFCVYFILAITYWYECMSVNILNQRPMWERDRHLKLKPYQGFQSFSLFVFYRKQ